MLINQKKTKVMLFNSLRSYDFTPKSTIHKDTDDFIEVVEEQKLLGQIIRSDMKTISNTIYICQKAYQRLCIVRRLKILSCETST